MTTNSSDKYKWKLYSAFGFLSISAVAGVYVLHDYWTDSAKLQGVAAALSWASSMGLVFFAIAQVVHAQRQADVLEQERNAAKEKRKPFIHLRLDRVDGEGLVLFVTNLSRTPVLLQHINVMDPQARWQ